MATHSWKLWTGIKLSGALGDRLCHAHVGCPGYDHNFAIRRFLVRVAGM